MISLNFRSNWMARLKNNADAEYLNAEIVEGKMGKEKRLANILKGKTVLLFISTLSTALFLFVLLKPPKKAKVLEFSGKYAVSFKIFTFVGNFVTAVDEFK